MERIKDLSKLIIQDDMVLLKIKEKPAPLIAMTDQKGPEIEYSTIVLKGNHPKCERLPIGGIVILMSNMTLEVYEYKGETYTIVPEFTIKMVVPADNFDKDYVKPIKSSLTIN